jgi:YfiH family protein
MIRKNRGEIEWLEFELLQEAQVKHGVFLRNGGDAEKALEVDDILFFNQVHGKEIAVIEEKKCELKVDGAITKTKGIALGIKHADCQAAIFYDPVQKVLATVHAGWRGLVQNIYSETVSRLKKEFFVTPENLIVCIGPSLEPEHSEFIHYKQEFPQSFWSFQEKPNYFNMWEIAKFQLKELGVVSRHIEVAEIGTYSNPNDFYSYRRDKETLFREKGPLRNLTVSLLV